MTVDQRRCAALKHGAIAGPDPWKGNTLEWFTTSPPPVNNFDVDPARALGRADEGHPPPGRAPDGRDRTSRRSRRPSPRCAPDGRAARHAPSRARRRRAPARWSPTTSTLTKPQGPVAAAVDDGHDDARRRRPVARLIVADAASAATCRPAAPARSTTVYDRDIDAQMPRTADRPVPAGPRLAARGADRSASCSAALSFVELSLPVNLLAAALSLAGFVGYVARLHGVAQAPHAAEHRHRRRRRRGAAARRLGRGHRRPRPARRVYLFAIVFFWTPPHFWALSLLMKDEYARVGVPMLPVVRGEDETRRQILLYTRAAVRGDAAAVLRRRLRGDLPRRLARARRRCSSRGAVLLQPPRRPRARRCALYLFSLAYLAAAVRRDGRRRQALGSRPGSTMDRNLARKNIRTGLIVTAVVLLHVRHDVRGGRDLRRQ